MPAYFFDSSALAKHFHHEAGTDRIEELLVEAGGQHFIARLELVELHSVIAGKIRGGLITAEDAAAIVALIRSEIRRHKYSVVRMLVRHFEQAEALIDRHAALRRLRTLDALHLAVALDLHGRSPLSGFVCADHGLCEAAGAEGLVVICPN